MNVQYSEKLINATFMDIYVKPFVEENEITNNSRNLNLTSWKVLDFLGNSLEL